MLLTDYKVEMISIRKFVEDVLVALGLVTILAYSVKPIMLPLFLINLQKKQKKKPTLSNGRWPHIAFDSGASGPGPNPGRGQCVVFLGKTLYSHSASLHPGV